MKTMDTLIFEIHVDAKVTVSGFTNELVEGELSVKCTVFAVSNSILTVLSLLLPPTPKKRSNTEICGKIALFSLSLDSAVFFL